jgi:hypothetical protein
VYGCKNPNVASDLVNQAKTGELPADLIAETIKDLGNYAPKGDVKPAAVALAVEVRKIPDNPDVALAQPITRLTAALATACEVTS